MNAEAKRYEGKEPYIFISYSHADRERVLAIVAAMDRRGYRVWYDKGIRAGTKWKSELANKIAGCEAFMPFISANFINSADCMDEAQHAHSDKRNIVPVKLDLDRKEFSETLKYLLQDNQGFSVDDFPTPDAFAARLDKEPLFQGCRRVTVSDAVVTRNRPVTPSEEFVGREEIMRDIEKLLRDGTEPVILYGAGGIGKSEICRKLFQRYAQDAETRFIKHIGWAMWRGTLKETFYGQFLGIEDANIDAHWQKAQAYMQTLGADLLMFLDNADKIPYEDEERLTAFGCRFLITSRQTEHSERVRTIQADSLTPEECRTLYRRAYPNNAAPDDALDEIINLAGRHTLAVRLLAKTQRAARLSAEALLDKLRKSDFDLRGKIKYRHTPEDDADNTASEKGAFIDHMSRIFVLSRLRDVEDGEDALRVLQGMSLLAPNTPIAFDALDKWLGLNGDFDGLNCAIDMGWLNETPGGVSIHAVIAAVVRKNAMPDEDFIDALAGRLRDDMIPEETEVFTNRLPVLAHAIALDNATCAPRTANYGKMLNQMGYLLFEQADYDNALAYDKRALDIEKETLGEEHRETATSYNNIGTVYDDMGDYANALEYHQKALRIFENVFGADHPDTATSYNNIGLVYWAQGDYDSALEYCQKALRIRESVLGLEHPATATAYNNIGSIYWAQGDHDRTLEYYQKALRIRESVLGLEHPATAQSYNNIGLVYRAQSDYDSALEYYQKALRIDEQALGTEHPDTAIDYHNIGTLYFAQGDTGKASQWLEKALAVRLNVLGAKHPLTKSTQEWLYFAKLLSGEE